jgi:hypothetical protein
MQPNFTRTPRSNTATPVHPLRDHSQSHHAPAPHASISTQGTPQEAPHDSSQHRHAPTTPFQSRSQLNAQSTSQRTRDGIHQTLPPSRRQEQRTTGQWNVEVDQRPGGRLPYPRVDYKHSLEGCPDYPMRSDDRNKVNTLMVRPGLLHLASDECQKACFGVYFVNHGNKRFTTCPYIRTPDRCRNSHNLQQGVIDFIVTKRGIPHRTIQEMIDSIIISGASGHVPPIRVPNAPSQVALTPAQQVASRRSNSSGQPRQTAPRPVDHSSYVGASSSVPLPENTHTPIQSNASANINSPVAPVYVGHRSQDRAPPRTSVSSEPFSTYTSEQRNQARFRAEDDETAQLVHKAPVTHHPDMNQSYQPNPRRSYVRNTYSGSHRFDRREGSPGNYPGQSQFQQVAGARGTQGRNPYPAYTSDDPDACESGYRSGYRIKREDQF